MKYIYAFLLSAFCFMLMPAAAFAGEHDDFYSLIGMSYEELQEFKDDEFSYSGYFPSVYSEFNPNYQKDEIMKVSGLSWSATVLDYPFNYSGQLSFGQWKLQGNRCQKVEMTFLNSGHPLFDDGGILTFKVMISAKKFNYAITYSDGSTYSKTLTYNNSERVDIEFDFDNLGNDIQKIVFTWDGGFSYSDGDTRIGFGIVDYGYLHDSVDVPELDPEVPLVEGDLNGTIEYLVSFVVSVVDCLFLLQIVEGVTFGYFILACLILGVVFSFLFRKLVK